MKALILSALAALTLAGAAQAQAVGTQARDCQLRMEPESTQWIIRPYDPFEGARPTGSYQITFVNDGDRVCRGDLDVRLNGEAYGLKSEAAPSASRLPYVLVDEFNGRDLTPYGGVPVNQLGRQLIQVDPGERLVRRYSLAVDDRNLPADGMFSQTVDLRVLRNNGVIESQRQVTLGVDVRPSAVMGLAGTFTRRGGVARIDLGELREGVSSLPVSLWVRSTRGYRVDIASENQGRLVNDVGGWSIPYSLSLGGNAIDLGERSPLRTRNTVGLRDDSYPLVVVVGDLDGMRAGRYADLLTLTLAPL